MEDQALNDLFKKYLEQQSQSTQPSKEELLQAQLAAAKNPPKQEPAQSMPSQDSQDDSEDDSDKQGDDIEEDSSSESDKPTPPAVVPKGKLSAIPPGLLNQLTSINFGNSSLGSNDQLKQIQQQAENQRLQSRIGSAAELIGAGIAGIGGGPGNIKQTVPMGQAGWAQADKDADQKVQNYKDQIENQKNDPNSSLSQGMRDFFKRFNVDVHGNASAGDLEKVFPQIVKAYEMEEKRRTELQISTERAKDRDLQRQSLQGNKELQQQLQQDRLNESKEKTLNNQYQIRTKQPVMLLENADKALTLIDKIKSGDLIDSTQIANTLSSDLARLAIGQNTGASDRQKYAVNTLQTSIAKIKDFMQSNPHSSIPPQYLQQMEIEANALKDEAGKSYTRQVSALKSGTNDPYKKDLLENISSQYMSDHNLQGISGKSGGSSQSKPGGNVSADTLSQYAKTHNMSEDDAKKYLTSKGYKVE